MGCHFLLQCMKVKSESEVAQSCLTLSDPMDCSLPGSSVHGILQARVLEWGAIVPLLSMSRSLRHHEVQHSRLPCSSISPTVCLNPGIKARSPSLKADSLLSEPPGKPYVYFMPHKEKSQPPSWMGSTLATQVTLSHQRFRFQ